MKLFTNSMEEDTSLGVLERVAYGMGNFANAFMFIAIMAFLTFYYTNVVGLSAGVIGTIMLVSRCFDGITDLIMGYIVDHSKDSKFGKARRWLLRSCIPFAISGVIVFMVPQKATDVLKYLFVFISYNVCNSIFYTAVSVSFNTLMVKMTRNTVERGLLGIFVMVFSSIGGLVVTSTCLKQVNAFGGDARAWTLTILVYGVIGLVAHLICIFGTKERIHDADEAKADDKAGKMSFVESFKYLFKNKYWVIVVLAFSIYWIAYTLTQSGMIYYAQYILGDQNHQVSMANIMQILSLVGMLVAFVPMKLMGKANTIRLGFGMVVVSLVLQFLMPHSVTGILAACFLKGAGWGVACAILGGLCPDTLDYGEYVTGKNVTGMGVAAVGFGQKIGSGLGGAIFGLVLSAGKYDGTAETLVDSAIRAIHINYTWIPLALTVVSLVLMMFYNLDKKLPEVQAELKRRRNAA